MHIWHSESKVSFQSFSFLFPFLFFPVPLNLFGYLDRPALLRFEIYYQGFIFAFDIKRAANGDSSQVH